MNFERIRSAMRTCPRLHLTVIRRSLRLSVVVSFALVWPGCAGPAGVSGPDAGQVEVAEPAEAADTLAPVGQPAPPGWEEIGSSAEGRPVHARTLGRGVRRVALIAGIHGDEREGLSHVAELIRLLGSSGARVRLIEDVNPDGTARRRRSTSSGVDPNRNWPARNFAASKTCGPRPLSEPEVAAVHADLVRFEPELVIVLHSDPRGPYVNFDGPARELAERFAREAGEPWRVVPDMGYPTPGSFGSWMGVDRRVPTLTIELRRGDPANGNGPALARAISAVVEAFAGGRPGAGGAPHPGPRRLRRARAAPRRDPAPRVSSAR